MSVPHIRLVLIVSTYGQICFERSEASKPNENLFTAHFPLRIRVVEVRGRVLIVHRLRRSGTGNAGLLVDVVGHVGRFRSWSRPQNMHACPSVQRGIDIEILGRADLNRDVIVLVG